MVKIKRRDELVKKVNEAKKEDSFDLSKDEDLSIALMNLVSIEEHLYFTGIKTDKKKYFELMGDIREIRKELLKEIVVDPEGEVWCISKHLLACSMRLIEVGNKLSSNNEKEKAQTTYEKAFQLYSLFWGINKSFGSAEKFVAKKKGRFDDLALKVKSMIDCCKE